MLQTQNPQSSSSYSLRALKSLHEIFRAPFLIIGLKTAKAVHLGGKTFSKKTRVKRGFSKQFLPTQQNTSALPKTVYVLPKTSKQQNKPFSYSSSTVLPISYHFLQLARLEAAETVVIRAALAQSFRTFQKQTHNKAKDM